MEPTHPQIWISLFHTILTVAGSLIGLLVLLFVFSFLSNFSSRFSKVKQKFNLSLLPDAEGEKKRVSKAAPVILQLNLKGMIGTELLNLEEIETQLIEARLGELGKNRVKGIFLYIDSPGGSAKDSDAIYRRLKAFKEKVRIPIYAYADGLLASGSYLIACAADKIYTSPTSIVGSVGVRLMLPFFNVYKVLEKWEVGVRTFSEGKHKDLLNPFRPWEEGEEGDLKALLADSYDRFVDIVVQERSQISRDKLIEEYGARIYSAKEAERLQFIDDGKSDYAKALQDLIGAAGIEKQKPYQVVEFVKKKNWVREMLQQSPFFTGRLTHQLQNFPLCDPSLSGRIAYIFLP